MGNRRQATHLPSIWHKSGNGVFGWLSGPRRAVYRPSPVPCLAPLIRLVGCLFERWVVRVASSHSRTLSMTDLTHITLGIWFRHINPVSCTNLSGLPSRRHQVTTHHTLRNFQCCLFRQSPVASRSPQWCNKINLRVARPSGRHNPWPDPWPSSREVSDLSGPKVSTF